MPDGGPISRELQETTARNLMQELETLIEPYPERIEIKSDIIIGTLFIGIIREVLQSGHDIVINWLVMPAGQNP